ncbi:MAG: hypothetical protein FWF86_03960, partial [Clostridia bacterium]|nr:hypothetical protein [Clostridia bacterium]
LHWKAIFIVLCIGGFMLDRPIFFFRWRPDYVWSTKLERLKRRFSRGDAMEPAYPLDYADDWETPPFDSMPYEASQDLPMTRETRLSQNSQNAFGYYDLDESGASSLIPASSFQDFAPLASGYKASYEPVSSPAMTQPVLKEPAEDWGGYAETSDLDDNPFSFHEETYAHPVQDMPSAFGEAAFKQAGYHEGAERFAPPPSSEELTQTRAAPILSELVHPGLDLDTFHQNIGLPIEGQITGGDPPREPPLEPTVDFPNTTYVPYYHAAEPTTDHHAKGALSAFAKKARTIISIDDESNPRTIRDIQMPISVKAAFHPPVMPRKPDDGDEA